MTPASSRRLITEAEEASIVRLIFDLYVTNRHSRPTIAHLLNAKEVRPPRNNTRWTSFKVDSLLTDPCVHRDEPIQDFSSPEQLRGSG